MTKLDHCENTIEKQIVKLIKDKKVQDTIHAQVCDKFADFVACVGQLQSECDSLGKYRKNLCERRAVKLNSYRYTWRYDFIHNLCAGNKHAGKLVLLNQLDHFHHFSVFRFLQARKVHK